MGACNRDRTGDLVLTKDVLYQLSYAGDMRLPATVESKPDHHQSDLRFQRAQTPEPPHFSTRTIQAIMHPFDGRRAGKVAKATFVSKEIAG